MLFTLKVGNLSGKITIVKVTHANYKYSQNAASFKRNTRI